MCVCVAQPCDEIRVNSDTLPVVTLRRLDDVQPLWHTEALCCCSVGHLTTRWQFWVRLEVFLANSVLGVGRRSLSLPQMFHLPRWSESVLCVKCVPRDVTMEHPAHLCETERVRESFYPRQNNLCSGCFCKVSPLWLELWIMLARGQNKCWIQGWLRVSQEDSWRQTE